ncbi:MAG: apolipoprotein N-acyltransferase [Bryobacteraceae bacterium]
MLNLLLALASGILLILTFPRFDFPYLITVALTPLLIAAAREPRGTRRFLLGWLTGASCLAGITDWIRFVITFHGKLTDAAGWPVFLLYCAAKGLYFGLFAWLAGPLLRISWAIPAIAALWVSVDVTAGQWMYVWVTFGNAGADMSVPLRLAPLAGVHALSFVFMMMATACALLVLRRPRLHLAWLLPLPLLWLLPELPAPAEPQAEAAVVQPNVDEETGWTRESTDVFHRRMVALSLQSIFEPGHVKPDLVVWPEVPAPLYPDDDALFRRHIEALAMNTGLPVLFGGVAHTSKGAPLNSAFLYSPHGTQVSRYDKIHLVPFGEFVPWPLAAVTEKISGEVGDFEAGTSIVVSRVGRRQAASFICYESAFPGLVRSFVHEGAEVLFNLSNDGYFGRSPSARGQHLLLVRMRAAENRRWILRATNDGITAAVDPAGRVVKRMPSFAQSAGRLPFSYVDEETFYTRHGAWFPIVCFLIAAPALLLNIQHFIGTGGGVAEE